MSHLNSEAIVNYVLPSRKFSACPSTGTEPPVVLHLFKWRQSLVVASSFFCKSFLFLIDLWLIDYVSVGGSKHLDCSPSLHVLYSFFLHNTAQFIKQQQCPRTGKNHQKRIRELFSMRNYYSQSIDPFLPCERRYGIAQGGLCCQPLTKR